VLLFRHVLIVALLVAPAVTAISPTPLAAQTDQAEPSDVELYERGMDAFEAENYTKARDLFRRLDPMQLPQKEQRVELFRALQAIDRKLQPEAAERATTGERAPGQTQPDQPQQPSEPADQAAGPPAESDAAESAKKPDAKPSPTALLEQARARADQDLSDAAALYNRVLASDEAGEATKRKARAELAQLRRMQNPDRTESRELIEMAADAIERGDYQQAKQRLDTVESAEVELGWFDQQQIKRQRQVIEQNRQPRVAQKEPAQPTEPAEPQAGEATAGPSQGEAGQSAEPADSPAKQDTPFQPAEGDAQAEGVAGAAQAGGEDTEPAPRVAPEADQPQAEDEDADQPTPERETDQPPSPAEPARADAADQAQAQGQADESAAEPQGQPTPPEDAFAEARQFYASRRADQAEKAMEAGQYELAVKRYQQALRFTPDDQQLERKLQAARSARAEAAGEQGLIGQQTEVQSARRDQVVAEFENLLDEAQKARQARDYAKAQELINQAKVVLEQNRQLLGTDAFQRLSDRASQLSVQIADEKQAYQRFVQERDEAEAELEERRAEQRQQRQDQQEIQRLLKEAMRLRKDMKYDQAMERVEQALFIDETNIAAQAMKQLVEQGRIVKQSREAERVRDKMFARQSVKNLEATTPYDEIIRYPDNWPQLSERRRGTQAGRANESEADRRIRQALNQSVPIEFDNVQLSNVIDYFKNTTEANFFVNWPTLQDAGVPRDTPIDLQLTNIPASRALDLVLEQAGARSIEPIDYAIIDGIVQISTRQDLETSTTTRVYDIRDLLVQVPNFSNAPEFDLRSALESRQGGSGGGGGGGQGEGIFGDEEDDDEEEEQLTRADMIEQITTLIQDTVGDPQDWGPGASSSLRELSGNLIVRTTSQNQREVRQLLDQLRQTRAVQISVQARFLMVTDQFLEDIGVDFDLEFQPSGDDFGPIRLAQDSQALAAPPNITESGILGQFSPGGIGPGGTFVPGEGVTNPETGRSFDIGASFQDNLSANLLVRATQADERSFSLDAPRVTFFNGQRAYVVVAEQIAFVSDLEPVPNAFGFDPELQTVSEGVVLDVEGTVSADRRYVTLTLRPSLAEATIEDFPIASGGIIGGGGGDNGDQFATDAEQSIQLPTVDLTSVRATVSIPDRGTLLIGGQRVVDEVEREAGVPVLSKVPVFNRLFTNNSTVKDERTLLILVKPRIIIQNEEERVRFPEMQGIPSQ